MAHLHSIYDTDPHFSIDPVTRAIKNESTRKTALVQGDHNSERFTFEMPRMVEGHDMSLSTRIEVHFINIASDKSGQSENVYIVDDMQISPNSEDESIIIFSWLLSGNATLYNGSLAFAIRFVCLDGETLEYAWHTAPYTSLSITKGINNGEAVIEDNSDILAKWEQDIDELTRRVKNIEEYGCGELEIAQEIGTSAEAVMSQGAATRSFVNINEDGSASVGAPTSGESAINAYALKRHLSRHSTLYPSKEENGVTVYNKLKFVMPENDPYFALTGDHSADVGGGNPKVEFDIHRPVYIPSVVPAAQYDKDPEYKRVPVDLPVNSINQNSFEQNRSVRSVVIQEGISRIEANAFNGCKQLTSIVLADTIKMIDNNAFNNVGTEVSSVKITVKLPKALEYICEQAFNNVNVCGSIVIPNRCLYIGGTPSNLTGGSGKVFNSPNITQIVFEGTPKYIHSATFEGCTCDIYVPWSEGEVAGAPWGTAGTVHYNSYPNAITNDMWDGTQNAIQSNNEATTQLRSDQSLQNERHNALAARVEALEGGSSIEIVQEMGESTTAVMSQDAVTTALEGFVPKMRTPSNAPTQAYIANYGETKLYPISKTGGDIASIVMMDGYHINGIEAPAADKHLTNKKYVDAVYRHDITLVGGFDYMGTIGYMACTVYSRNNTPWDTYGFDCTLTSRTTATGIINIEGTDYTIVGLEKGNGSVSYYICYAKLGKTEIAGEEKNTYIVEKFNFYDGEGTFTDTVTQMI